MTVGNKLDNEIFSKSTYYYSFLFRRPMCSRTCSYDSLGYSRVFSVYFQNFSTALDSFGNLIS